MAFCSKPHFPAEKPAFFRTLKSTRRHISCDRRQSLNRLRLPRLQVEQRTCRLARLCENAAAMANHASTRTTQLYDRRRDDVSLDEVERIAI
jgi:hypothetical protein